MFFDYNAIKLTINNKLSRKRNYLEINTPLNNPWVKENIRKHLKSNRNENTTYQLRWYLRKMNSLKCSYRKEERSKIDDLTFHLWKPEDKMLCRSIKVTRIIIKIQETGSR